MAGYQRMVSYLYEYVNGEKGENVGYAKLEIREQAAKMILSIRMRRPVQDVCPVHFYYREGRQAYRIPSGGRIVLSGGRGEERILIPGSVAGASGIPVGQMNGLLIELPEGFIGSAWDDQRIPLPEECPGYEERSFMEEGMDLAAAGVETAASQECLCITSVDGESGEGDQADGSGSDGTEPVEPEVSEAVTADAGVPAEAFAEEERTEPEIGKGEGNSTGGSRNRSRTEAGKREWKIEIQPVKPPEEELLETETLEAESVGEQPDQAEGMEAFVQSGQVNGIPGGIGKKSTEQLDAVEMEPGGENMRRGEPEQESLREEEQDVKAETAGSQETACPYGMESEEELCGGKEGAGVTEKSKSQPVGAPQEERQGKGGEMEVQDTGNGMSGSRQWQGRYRKTGRQQAEQPKQAEQEQQERPQRTGRFQQREQLVEQLLGQFLQQGQQPVQSGQQEMRAEQQARPQQPAEQVGQQDIRTQQPEKGMELPPDQSMNQTNRRPGQQPNQHMRRPPVQSKQPERYMAQQPARPRKTEQQMGQQSGRPNQPNNRMGQQPSQPNRPNGGVARQQPQQSRPERYMARQPAGQRRTEQRLDRRQEGFVKQETPAQSAAAGQDMVEYFFQNGARMCPFEDGEITSCVRIEPADLEYFPKETWILGSNSFLLHGYYTYGHLILAKKKGMGKDSLIIGVPGVYQNRERFLARMFGFEYFKPISKEGTDEGNFGYWYLFLPEIVD